MFMFCANSDIYDLRLRAICTLVARIKMSLCAVRFSQSQSGFNASTSASKFFYQYFDNSTTDIQQLTSNNVQQRSETRRAQLICFLALKTKSTLSTRYSISGVVILLETETVSSFTNDWYCSAAFILRPYGCIGHYRLLQCPATMYVTGK
jgi:hypothetical protein